MTLGGRGLVEAGLFMTLASRPRKPVGLIEPGLTALTWTPSRLPRSASALMKASIAATTDAPTMEIGHRRTRTGAGDETPPSLCRP